MTTDEMNSGLFDSATGETLEILKVVDLGFDDDGDTLRIVYMQAQRGRIAQIRVGDCLRIHYFIDEHTMDENGEAIGRWLCMNVIDALRLIRDRAPDKV